MSEAPPPYYRDGDTWDREVFGRLQQSRKRAWALAIIAIVVALLCLLALVLVLPLKEFAPYVITLDKNTGHIEVTQGLKPGDLTDNEAVTMANIVKYLVARETYDPADLKENFDIVNLYSAEAALADYRRLYDRSNKERPTELYGYHTTIGVTIKNVSFLNEHTATVRFLTNKQANDRKVIEAHWIAIVTFRYVQTPTALKDRFVNPLGFQVTGYRRDQEIINQPISQ